MYRESIPNRASKPAILLRESKRENGYMKKRTLANLIDLPDDLVANFKMLLKGRTTRSRIEADTISSELQRRVFELLGVHS